MAQKGGRRTYKKGGMGCHTKKHKGVKRKARRSRKTRRARRGGGGLFSAAKTPLLPFVLFKAQKRVQKKRRSTRRK